MKVIVGSKEAILNYHKLNPEVNLGIYDWGGIEKARGIEFSEIVVLAGAPIDIVQALMPQLASGKLAALHLKRERIVHRLMDIYRGDYTPGFALCGTLTNLDARQAGLNLALKTHIFETWVHFSGWTAFPVPDPSGQLNPDLIFGMTYNYYDGEYGRLRRNLAGHMARVLSCHWNVDIGSAADALKSQSTAYASPSASKESKGKSLLSRIFYKLGDLFNVNK